MTCISEMSNLIEEIASRDSQNVVKISSNVRNEDGSYSVGMGINNLDRTDGICDLIREELPCNKTKVVMNKLTGLSMLETTFPTRAQHMKLYHDIATASVLFRMFHFMGVITSSAGVLMMVKDVVWE